MSTLREVQLFGLKILKEVVKICDDNNLKYYLSSGTLLGAVRHKGFIPWDNDIDIEMPIEDYRVFLKIAKKSLPEWLFLQTYYTDPGYNNAWAKVRANGTTSLPLNWKELPIHFGIGIDIFPIVGLHQNKLMRRLQDKSLQLCKTLISKEFVETLNPTELKDNKKLQLIYKIPQSIRFLIYKVFERIAFKNMNSSKKVSMVFVTIKYQFDKDFYGAGVELEFENEMFNSPNNYDEILKGYYGDYMIPPPINERGTGHELTHGKIIYECEKDYRQYLQGDVNEDK